MIRDYEFDLLLNTAKKITNKRCYDTDPGDAAAFNLGMREYAHKYNLSYEQLSHRIAERLIIEAKAESKRLNKKQPIKIKSNTSFNTKVKAFIDKTNKK